eukprot:3290301-Prymnesium_polylepis.1
MPHLRIPCKRRRGAYGGRCGGRCGRVRLHRLKRERERDGQGGGERRDAVAQDECVRAGGPARAGGPIW